MHDLITCESKVQVVVALGRHEVLFALGRHEVLLQSENVFELAGITMLRERGQTSTTSCNIQNVARPFSNLIQHVATYRNSVAKRMEHGVPNNVARSRKDYVFANVGLVALIFEQT